MSSRIRTCRDALLANGVTHNSERAVPCSGATRQARNAKAESRDSAYSGAALQPVVERSETKATGGQTTERTTAGSPNESLSGKGATAPTT